MAKKIKVPAGCVLMRHPDPDASCSVGGVGYAAKNGLVIVPSIVVGDLTAHGFYPDGAEADQDPAVAEPEPEAEAEVEADVEAEVDAAADAAAAEPETPVEA